MKVWSILVISIVMTANVKSGYNYMLDNPNKQYETKKDTSRAFPQTVYIRNFRTAGGSIPQKKYLSKKKSGIILSGMYYIIFQIPYLLGIDIGILYYFSLLAFVHWCSVDI